MMTFDNYEYLELYYQWRALYVEEPVSDTIIFNPKTNITPLFHL